MNSVLRHLRNYFIAGIIILLPVVITVYVFWAAFRILDGFFGDLVEYWIGRSIPGVGVLATLALIFLVGMFGTNVLGRKLIGYGEALLARIPLVRGIYSTVKQVVDAVAIQNRQAFKRVALIEYPRSGIYSIGFITRDHMKELDSAAGQECVGIFVPTTPNPTSGVLVNVPRSDVRLLDMSVEEGLKLVISGGVLAPNGNKKGAKPGDNKTE